MASRSLLLLVEPNQNFIDFHSRFRFNAEDHKPSHPHNPFIKPAANIPRSGGYRSTSMNPERVKVDEEP
jgi:hypothetical protein